MCHSFLKTEIAKNRKKVIKITEIPLHLLIFAWLVIGPSPSVFLYILMFCNLYFRGYLLEHTKVKLILRPFVFYKSCLFLSAARFVFLLKYRTTMPITFAISQCQDGEKNVLKVPIVYGDIINCYRKLYRRLQNTKPVT